MKNINILITLLFLAFVSTLNAQTTKEKIYECVNNYIEGTSYNYIDRIEKAFYPEAELFLDGKDNKLRVVPAKEYIGYFEKGTPGEFTGRVGRIISVDYFGNIGTAKAEILLPKRNRTYIDMFILKEIEGEWKIISKTANSKETNRSGKRILFVTSNATHYGDTDIGTGNSFSEIVEAYGTFEKAGFTIDIVSPDGGDIPLAYINTSVPLHRQFIYDFDFMYKMKNTLSPKEVDSKNYEAVYYVGGGAAMFGVPENEAIQKIVMNIYEENEGIVSSVCHGTAGIVNLKTKDGKYLVDGKNVNGYPDEYENKERESYKTFPFKITQTIEKHGGNFKKSERGTPHVEVDGRLITGQNHLSSEGVAEKIIELLQANEN